MKLLFKFLLLVLPILVLAQKNSTVIQVKYDQFNNGKKRDSELKINYLDQIVFLSKPEDKIQQYTNFKNNENISTISYDGKLFKNVTPLSTLEKPSLGDKTEDILGYKCQYASYKSFSNTIEVWYTEKTAAKGSPYSRFLPNNNALVLKIIINGNREIRANSINKLKVETLPKYLADEAKQVTEAEFEEIKINSRYTKIEIFNNETINFDNAITVPTEAVLQENQTYHFSKGSVIMKKIKLSSKLRNSGQVFAKLNCKSNGDAYDRTGSVFIIPSNQEVSVLNAYQYGLDKIPVFTDNSGKTYQGIRKEENFEPPIEILRFFTSFGAGHFNDKREINNYNWAKDVTYKQEITSLIPSDDAEIWVGVFIGNYDKGGHKVSLELDFYPDFNEEEETENGAKFIQSLFSTINTLEMSGQNYGKLFKNDTLRVNFEIPENMNNLQLLYTATGHGGWGGGDEFNPKLNQLFIDGKEVFKIVPWRTDCGTYRLSNPASGNFGNGLSSSDLSRSNWCPGMLTPAYIVPLENLKPGKHQIEVVINQGDNEGSSFNHWGVTGVLTGKIESMNNTTSSNSK